MRTIAGIIKPLRERTITTQRTIITKKGHLFEINNKKTRKIWG